MKSISNNDKSILEYDLSPLLQAGTMLLAVVIFILGGKLLAITGILDIDKGTPWLVACSFTLFYIIFNSVYSLSTEDQNKYWMHSIFGYGLVTIGGGILAYLFSGATMQEVGSYKVIYVVFSMGYILLLVIMRSMRKLVTIAQEQDGRLRGED